jgi:hypothetical protein
MRKAYFIFTLLLSIVIAGCRSDNDLPQPTIEGRWLMEQVVDPATGTSVFKPASVTGDVEIVFTLNTPLSGTFTGTTPGNLFYQNDFSIDQDRGLRIPVLSITKLYEPEWGELFSDNLTKAVRYGFTDAGKLIITTTTKVLYFKPRR